ncbi:MAG: energy transducer TonB [Gammaproteobacteria bacterium]|nr:energy transducer TonB [Gammaproteobacteria bacterium]NNK98260.1 energy transducer TonB [Xanthomonadales bacterium]
MNRLRTLVSALVAVGVTFGLFLFMFKLISSGGKNNEELEAIAGIHFGPVDIPDELVTKNRRIPKKPPPPKNPPPPPKMQVSKMNQAVQNMPVMDLPNLDVPMSGGEGMFIGNFASIDKTEEGDIIPIVVIRPMYPREAAQKGQEGWVKVAFTITAIGTVKNPKVIDAKPPRVFNREAIRAILKWKFKPRVVDGVAVERSATQIIDFNLDQSGG